MVGILPLHHFFFDSSFGWSIAASQASAASVAGCTQLNLCKENVLPSGHINQAGAFHLVQVCQQYLVKTLTFA
jgi:hypothetical protein